MHQNQSKTLRTNSQINKSKNNTDIKIFAIYPDSGWNTKKWGPGPLLGYVKETSEYWAKYAAYDSKLLRYNSTFGPKAVLVNGPLTQIKTRKPYVPHNKTR